MGHCQWQGYAKGLNDFVLKGLLCMECSKSCDLQKKTLIVHGPPLMTKHTNEKDHLVLEALTEGSEAGTLLLLLGKMLFLTHSAKGNPLGGLYIPMGVCLAWLWWWVGVGNDSILHQGLFSPWIDVHFVNIECIRGESFVS